MHFFYRSYMSTKNKKERLNLFTLFPHLFNLKMAFTFILNRDCYFYLLTAILLYTSIKSSLKLLDAILFWSSAKVS
uniref:Uncharacterized protein n=2 Tax=Anguilla anguilla TaxID=7936 RepID=A0A0E9Y0D0_ANGAN